MDNLIRYYTNDETSLILSSYPKEWCESLGNLLNIIDQLEA